MISTSNINITFGSVHIRCFVTLHCWLTHMDASEGVTAQFSSCDSVNSPDNHQLYILFFTSKMCIKWLTWSRQAGAAAVWTLCCGSEG